MIFRRNKNKYKAVFLIKREGSYCIVKKKRFIPSRLNIRYKKGSYPIDVSIPTYIKGLKMFYFIEVDKTQLFFAKNKNESMISPKIIDMIMSQKIVSQLTSNLGGSALKMSILTLIFGGIMGALIGYIVAGYV